MKKLIRTLAAVILTAAVLLTFGSLLDRALQQEAYKTCKQIPKEMRKHGDCEQFRP